MKTISSRVLGQIEPIRHRLQNAVRKGQVLPGIGIIAEQLGAEAIKVATRCSYIVDRIPWKACHIRRIEPPRTAATTSCRRKMNGPGGCRVPRRHQPALVVDLIDEKQRPGVAILAIVHDDEIRHLIAYRLAAV